MIKTTLSEYAKVQGGYAYKSTDFKSSGENRVLKIKNIRFGDVDYQDTVFISADLAEKTSDWKTKPNDILISMTGSGFNAPASLVGRVAKVKKNEPTAFINQRIGRIIVSDEIHSDFVYYWLSQHASQYYFVSNATGSANQVNINASTILSIDIPKISYERSKKIAEILNSLDNKIQLNNATNQTLEVIAQALFKSWFIDFNPVKAKIAALDALSPGERVGVRGQHLANQAAMTAISGKNKDKLDELQENHPEQYAELLATAKLFPSEMQDSELGQIPLGWEVSMIGEEVQVVGGATPSTKNTDFWKDGCIHWTTPKDLSGATDRILIDTDRKITKLGLQKISSGLLPVDTVLMSSRAPVGYLALVYRHA